MLEHVRKIHHVETLFAWIVFLEADVEKLEPSVVGARARLVDGGRLGIDPHDACHLGDRGSNFSTVLKPSKHPTSRMRAPSQQTSPIASNAA